MADLHEQIAAALPEWDVQVHAVPLHGDPETRRWVALAIPADDDWGACEGNNKETREEALRSLLEVLREHPLSRAETTALLAIPGVQL